MVLFGADARVMLLLGCIAPLLIYRFIMPTPATPIRSAAISALMPSKTIARAAHSHAARILFLPASYPARINERSGIVTLGTSKYRNSKLFPQSRLR